MRRVILGLLLSLVSFAAHAECPGNPPTCGNPMMSEAAGSVLYATGYGVKADATYASPGPTPTVTGTSNDVALAAAVDACAAKGGRLVLPPGMMLLTGAATINLRNCAVEGAGPMGGTGATAGGYGSMFLITSTSVKPFAIGDHWRMSGVNFFWPNQWPTAGGAQVYPPLFSPAGAETDGTAQWSIDHCVLINPYDGIVSGGGPFNVSDSWIYPMNDAFRVGHIGDSFRVTAMHFTPGPWFTMTGPGSPYGNVKDRNTIFHAQYGGSADLAGAVNFSARSIGAFAIGTGVKIDNQVTVGISEFDFILDGVGTVIDASSGGSWAGHANTPIRGVAGCADTCFKLGPNSRLFMNGFVGGSNKSFIITSGSDVVVSNSEITTVGGVDSSDYYFIHMTANTGGTSIRVHGNVIQGNTTQPTKVHGIKVDVPSPEVVIQGNSFLYFNDEIDVQNAPLVVISGNTSQNTAGTQSIITASLSGGSAIMFGGNHFDKPPQSTIVSGFGGGTIQGGFAGIIFNGGTSTGGSFKLPFPINGGGACQFTPSVNVVVSGGQSGTPPTWSIGASGALGGAQIYFNCAGAGQQ